MYTESAKLAVSLSCIPRSPLLVHPPTYHLPLTMSNTSSLLCTETLVWCVQHQQAVEAGHSFLLSHFPACMLPPVLLTMFQWLFWNKKRSCASKDSVIPAVRFCSLSHSRLYGPPVLFLLHQLHSVCITRVRSYAFTQLVVVTNQSLLISHIPRVCISRRALLFIFF